MSEHPPSSIVSTEFKTKQKKKIF